MNASPDFSLSGRRALITGSSRGIGHALALAFARSGADVAIHCVADTTHAREAAAAIRQLGRQSCVVEADLGADDGARRAYAGAVAGLGGIDILVCNASIQEPTPWLTVDRGQFDRQIAVNFRSTLELCQLAAPAMQRQRWGRILTVGSVQEAKPHPHMVVYAATKAAQTSLVHNLARQLAPEGVTVNNLAPGVIRTDRNSQRLADPAYAASVLASIPVGFFGTAEDCTGAALLLCSDAGRYITGHTLMADGGLSL